MARVCEPGAKILLPRAAIGNREILEELAKRTDLQVDDLATYDTLYQTQELIDEAREVDQRRNPLRRIHQRLHGERLCQACPELDYTKVKAACIGKQTCQAAEARGMKAYTAQKATMDSLLELVIRLKAEGNIEIS